MKNGNGSLFPKPNDPTTRKLLINLYLSPTIPLALCHVSLSSRAEAEHISTSPTLRDMLLNHDAPPSPAARIQTLSVTMPSQTSLQADDLTRALHLCINLHDLSILDGDPNFSGTQSKHGFSRDTFTLQKFANTYFTVLPASVTVPHPQRTSLMG